MFTKLFVSALMLVVGMSGASSITHAAEGKTPARTPTTVYVQDSGGKEARGVVDKTASDCYSACKRLAEFDNSASKPSKPGLAAAKKADLRREAAEYCQQAKTENCDFKCPYCAEAMAMNK